MSEKPTLDPRYPAAFQRGHGDSGDAVYHVTSRAEPARGTDAAAAPPARPTEPVGPEASAPAATSAATIAPPEPEGRNPFIALLWVLSLGLLIGGFWVISWAHRGIFGGYTGPEPPVDFVLAQVAWTLSAPAIQVGALGILGLLFWHAAAWRRRAMGEPRHPRD
ncbi:hypothetical protein OH146_08875 [Salinibacterium sp. SYSU T00001]|uniref:hypothetical protein n=1 Tax=Homoserinimonas sedimenticola TaxID=2986805 RepID=UPI002235E458|nr:hypothetical protein [Salinibacterium sedimenticola]MCW4385886.1 hypothetical protein [Salinibacterium sedimenticola]